MKTIIVFGGLGLLIIGGVTLCLFLVGAFRRK